MRSTVAILSVGMVILLEACATPVPVAAPTSGTARPVSDVTAQRLFQAPQPNGCLPNMPATFVAAKVQMLASNPNATFGNNFGGYDPNYVGPSPAGSASNEETKLLAQAFNLAPQWLQFQLCNQVNFVFVDPNQYQANSEFGWAFWESSDPKQTQNSQNHSQARFIGIAQAALDDKNITLSSSETRVLQILLGNPGSAPTVTASFTAGTDSAAWAVLAILAHEMGHLFWHDVCDGDSNQRDQRRCGSFHKHGWQNVGDHWTLREFGAPIPNAKHYPLVDDSVSIMKQTQPPFPALKRLYAGRNSVTRWVDLFAAVAPDEDVAETYKLAALTDSSDANRPRLAALTVSYGDNWNGDIVANLDRQELCSKLQFIETSLLQPARTCP
jgi:hypothetical protein